MSQSSSKDKDHGTEDNEPVEIEGGNHRQQHTSSRSTSKWIWKRKKIKVTSTPAVPKKRICTENREIEMSDNASEPESNLEEDEDKQDSDANVEIESDQESSDHSLVAESIPTSKKNRYYFS